MGFGVSGPAGAARDPAQGRSRIQRRWRAQFRDWAEIPNLKRIIVSHGDPIEHDPAGVLNELAETLDA